MKKHLAVFSKAAIQRILSGGKTIETRFSEKRIIPFGEVNVGDLVYMKQTGADVVGQFIVARVISIEGLSGDDWQILKEKYWDKISLGNGDLDEKFIEEHKQAKFVTIVFISKVEQFVTSPINFKKKDRRGWIILD